MVLRIPEPPPPIRPPLQADDPLFRPAIRRWARAVVRELRPPLPAIAPAPYRTPRLLAIFIDGLPYHALARGARDGRLRFLGALRDARGMREARCFSGMPSSTAAFQAGLFYGVPHPDVPAFNWLDRATGAKVRLNKPADAAAIEGRIARGAATPGLFSGGASYLSILTGGAEGHLNTAGVAPVLAGRRLPGPDARRLPYWVRAHRQHAAGTVARVLWEAALGVPDLAFAARRRTARHEGNFFLNKVLIGQLASGASRAEAILDLVHGAPRIFLNFHAFDEVSHRRGPAAAERTLREIDQAVEAILAVAAACDDPPEPWIFTDHGQIAATPFERLFGMTLSDWLRGRADGVGPPPELSPEVSTALGGRRTAPRPGPLPRVIDAGNYAHVYLGGEGPLDGAEIAERHPATLARALRCPGVGLVAVRSRGGARAFAGGRPVDPTRPETLPPGPSARAVAALLEDLARSPSAGDLVLYGSWFAGSCVAFSWEFSSHGGPSPAETETFVLHPADVPSDPSRIGHGADLHRILAARYDPRSACPTALVPPRS